MVFANYTLGKETTQYIGDNIQIYATDELYRQMGIDDVTYISTADLGTYDGEYAILPVSMPLVDYVPEGGIAKRFSSHIIPVFLGLTMIKEVLSQEEIAYLRQYEPIGCRDERTLETLRKYRIRCYLNGCFTLTLPARVPEKGPQDKVYIVDVPENMVQQIPEELKSGAEYRTHFHVFDKDTDAKGYAIDRLNEYKKNARLVITSLLHCAIPCIAFGIPVILLKDEVISFRFSWVEKILPIYTSKTIKSVNWNPQPIDISAIKTKIFENAQNQILKAYRENEKIYEISWFYETREKNVYENDACLSIKNFIDNNWLDYEAEYQYSFWGMTQVSEWIHQYIQENYSNAKLTHVYDSYKSFQYMGINSCTPDNIEQCEDEIVFVTALGAVKAAKKFFEKIQRKPDSYSFIEI